jgi:arsenate reductase (thioredoxin)
MYVNIKNYCDTLVHQFEKISVERRKLLETITYYIKSKQAFNKPVNLVYICTHNSRRSHYGQIWSRVAANYYGIKNIHSFSGGTEVTAFNLNAINSLIRVGFVVKQMNTSLNSTYHILDDDNEIPSVCFSKTYDDTQNPQKEFVAIMTCSEAEENCPFIPGAELRVGTMYEDPKLFDNTFQQDAKYDERCWQIALETLYVFSEL